MGRTRVGSGSHVSIGAILGQRSSGRSRKEASEIGRHCVIGSYTIIEENVRLSDDVEIWHHAILRSGTEIDSGSKIGCFAFVGKNCSVGRDVNVQSRTVLSGKTTLEDMVFVGPGACTYNDKYPIWSLRKPSESVTRGPIVSRGAVIGGGALLLPGIRVGSGAIVAAGAVVTKDVRPFSVVAGNPAREIKASKRVELLLEEARAKLA